MISILETYFCVFGIIIHAVLLGVFLLWQIAKFIAREELKRKARARLTDLVRQPLS